MFFLEAVAAYGTMTLLKMLSQLPETLRAAKAGSLIEYTKATRVEPIVLLDRNVAHLPYATNILYSACYMISSYYLQAVSLSVNVGKINPVAILDKLNPSRSASDNAAHTLASIFSAESYNGKLPSFSEKPVLVNSMESFSAGIDRALKRDQKERQENKNVGITRSSTDTSIAKEINEAANLSVGILINVEFTSENATAKIPVNIRLITSPVPPSTITNIVTNVTGHDKDTTERFYNWTSGQLSTIRDMVFCQDLIDKHRNTLIEDKSGIYKEMNNRKKQNRLSTIASLGTRPSVGTASNIMIMTKETATQIEAALGGRLDKENIRNKIFEDTMVMLMFVVDTRFEMLTVYHRSIALPTEIPIKALKSIEKKAPDMTEMLNALRQGQPPRF